jgi:ribosome recycling factor
MTKRSKKEGNSKYKDSEYNIEANSYDIKNIRRQTKKKVTKFKKESKWGEDS